MSGLPKLIDAYPIYYQKIPYMNTQKSENILSVRITKFAKNKKEEEKRTWKYRFSTFFGKSSKKHMLRFPKNIK